MPACFPVKRNSDRRIFAKGTNTARCGASARIRLIQVGGWKNRLNLQEISREAKGMK